MKKAVTLVLFLLILCAPYLLAAQVEVTSFICDPEEPQSGESVTVLIRLANKGYEQDVEVTCRLFINGELYDVKVVPVTRRSSSGVSFLWLAQSGSHVFSLEMSYYIGPAEYTDTFLKYVTVPGVQEEIDYYARALDLYDAGSYIQAKIMFEQAKRRFEEALDTDQSLACEEYILQCDQYIEANQLFNQAEQTYASEDYDSALIYYQQAKSLYQLLNDDRAAVCEEAINTIKLETQKESAQPPYYLFLLLPVIAAVIAYFWLRRKPPPSPFPTYVPEQRVEKKLIKGENENNPEIIKEMQKIESQLDTRDPETFKSLVEDFRTRGKSYDRSMYTPEEAHYIEEHMDGLKERIKQEGKKLQQIQKLKDLKIRCDMLLNQPVGDLVDAYNQYAQMCNALDQIPELQIPEQEEVKTKLKEYYNFIQQKARSGQSERR
jgi:hypothetical protein